jgi:excisionase family DNA binding protein
LIDQYARGFQNINRPMNLITTKSAAEILGVTPVRVRQLIQQGQLAAEKHGRDHLLQKEKVQQFNRHGRRPGGRPPKITKRKHLRMR